MLIFDGSRINITISFLSGIITFFASCLLPLVPVYIAYLSGVSLSVKSNKNKWIILKTSTFFVLGFITVFIALGASFALLSRALAPYMGLIEKLGGLLLIVLGLQISKVLKTSALSRDFHLSLGNWMRKNVYLHSLLTGITFGFGWSPCVGPVLGVILFWASRQSTYGEGLLMLLFYGLGLGIPFILVGLGVEKFMPLLKKSRKFISYIEIISGLLIITAGVLLFLGILDQIAIKIIYFFGLEALSA